jgi:phosphoribulokinase
MNSVVHTSHRLDHPAIAISPSSQGGGANALGVESINIRSTLRKSTREGDCHQPFTRIYVHGQIAKRHFSCRQHF